MQGDLTSSLLKFKSDLVGWNTLFPIDSVDALMPYLGTERGAKMTLAQQFCKHSIKKRRLHVHWLVCMDSQHRYWVLTELLYGFSNLRLIKLRESNWFQTCWHFYVNILFCTVRCSSELIPPNYSGSHSFDQILQ